MKTGRGTLRRIHFHETFGLGGSDRSYDLAHARMIDSAIPRPQARRHRRPRASTLEGRLVQAPPRTRMIPGLMFVCDRRFWPELEPPVRDRLRVWRARSTARPSGWTSRPAIPGISR